LFRRHSRSRADRGPRSARSLENHHDGLSLHDHTFTHSQHQKYQAHPRHCDMLTAITLQSPALRYDDCPMKHTPLQIPTANPSTFKETVIYPPNLSLHDISETSVTSERRRRLSLVKSTNDDGSRVLDAHHCTHYLCACIITTTLQCSSQLQSAEVPFSIVSSLATSHSRC